MLKKFQKLEIFYFYFFLKNLDFCDHFKHKILKIRHKLQKLWGFEIGRKCKFLSLAPRHGAKYEFYTEIWMNPSSGVLVDSKKHSGYPGLKRQVVSVPCKCSGCFIQKRPKCSRCLIQKRPKSSRCSIQKRPKCTEKK